MIAMILLEGLMSHEHKGGHWLPTYELPFPKANMEGQRSCSTLPFKMSGWGGGGGGGGVA